MDFRKRKLPSLGLERRVRARAEPEPDLNDFEDELGSDAPSEENFDEPHSDTGAGSESQDDDQEPVSGMAHDTRNLGLD